MGRLWWRIRYIWARWLRAYQQTRGARGTAFVVPGVDRVEVVRQVSGLVVTQGWKNVYFLP
jgi:hypothetical protein